MRVALYARVSTESQEARGTIESQVEALREWACGEGHEIVAEFRDDGHSGAHLDRPGLDALRDAAEAGQVDAACCLTPDRLSRSYAHQVVVLEEFARHDVAMLFSDAPALADDPEARLLTQVQGVIAEYERAKIAERNRRGKLWRSRLGEVISGRAPFGYRRIRRSGSQAAHLVVHEPEAAVVRGIFDDYVAGGHSSRQIVLRLNDKGVPSPLGKAWACTVLSRLLGNEAYVGRIYYNKSETVPGPRRGRSARRRRRPREEWIEIPVPRIVSDDIFEAAQKAKRDNSQWSPRKAEPGRWLLRGLVKCGPCGHRLSCHRTRSRGPYHYYYFCPRHDPAKAGGRHLCCTERHVRADALDEFVFDQVREVLKRPDVLLAGESAVASRNPLPDDEILGAQLHRLERKAEAARAERHRLVDVYQAGHVDRADFQRRVVELDSRQRSVDEQREALIEQREILSKDNRLRQRLGAFAARVSAVLDDLGFEEKQKLMRSVVEEIRVTGWNVELRLNIPLEECPSDDSPDPQPGGEPRGSERLSRNDRLRDSRLGTDEYERVAPTGAKSAQADPEQAIRPSKART